MSRRNRDMMRWEFEYGLMPDLDSLNRIPNPPDVQNPRLKPLEDHLDSLPNCADAFDFADDDGYGELD